MTGVQTCALPIFTLLAGDEIVREAVVEAALDLEQVLGVGEEGCVAVVERLVRLGGVGRVADCGVRFEREEEGAWSAGIGKLWVVGSTATAQSWRVMDRESE